MVKGGRRWWTSDGITWNGGERGRRLGFDMERNLWFTRG